MNESTIPAKHPCPPSATAAPQPDVCAAGTEKTSVFDWFRQRQGRIAIFCLCFSIALLLLWPHAVITIGPGHTGVLYRRFLGGTVTDKVFPEGTHFIFPWDTLFIFDVRIHEEQHTFRVLTQNGLMLELDISLLYHPDKDRLPELLVSIGGNYAEKVIAPSLRSAVLRVAARHEKSDFYSPLTSNIQDAILVNIVEAVGRRPLTIDNFFLRTVRLPEEVNIAINEKFVAQQQVERQAFKVEEAAQRFRSTLIEAEAVRMSQQLVNADMTENFLRWKGIEATRLLAASPNSKFVIVGGKDGLPIILNPEAAQGAAGPPEERSAVQIPGPVPAQPGAEGGQSPGAALPAGPLPATPLPASPLTDAPMLENLMRRIDLQPLNEKMNTLLDVVFPGRQRPSTPDAATSVSGHPGQALIFVPPSENANN